MSPFQPTVVRGFSKYTRITISSVSAYWVRTAIRRRAYSTAAAGSWMEQGPMTTIRRSSLPAMMLWMFLRVWVISDSTGVPPIGKKRIRCSGGGNTVMSLIRSSSVWLVFSTLRYQASLVGLVVAVMVASSWSRLEWMEKRED